MTTKSKSISLEPTPAPAADDADEANTSLNPTEGPTEPTDPNGVDMEAEIAAKIEAIDEVTELDAGVQDDVAVPSQDSDPLPDPAGDVSMTDGTAESIPIDPALSGVPVAV